LLPLDYFVAGTIQLQVNNCLAAKTLPPDLGILGLAPWSRFPFSLVNALFASSVQLNSAFFTCARVCSEHAVFENPRTNLL
jgi:hypothetical protein